MKWAWIPLMVLCALGCSREPTAPETKASSDSVATAAPAPSLYEQFHSALFQIDPAVKKVADAQELAEEIKPKTKGEMAAGVDSLLSLLDDTGRLLAEVSGTEPPTEEQIKANQAKYEQDRTNLAKGLEDVLKELRGQDSVVEGLKQQANVKAQADRLSQTLDEIIDDLEGARDALR